MTETAEGIIESNSIDGKDPKSVFEDRESESENEIDKTNDVIIEDVETVIAPHDDSELDSEEDEIPEDPVIPADAEEQGTEAEAASNLGRLPRPDVQIQAPAVNNLAIGLITENVKIEQKTNITKEEKEEKEWQKINRLVRSKGVVWGHVTGVTRFENNTFSVLTEIYGRSVSIPENMFFVRDMKSYNRYYVAMDEKDMTESQINRIKTSMRRDEAIKYIGALIPFVIIGAERRHVRSRTSGARYYEYTLIGSRKEGMETLQDYWFFHERKRYSRRKDHTVAEGQTVDNAHILIVEENGVLVEVCGVETWMDVFEVNARHLDDARLYYHSGDTVTVLLRKLHLRNSPSEKYIRISPSMRLAQEQEAAARFDSVQINDFMRGTVSRISRNGNYIVVLDNGVRANIFPDRVVPRSIINVGDMVVVHVKSKSADYMSVGGTITKIL